MRPALAIALTLTATPVTAADGPRDAAALLRRACAECHGPEKQKGGLRLDSRAAVLKGGDTGPAVVPGTPDRGGLLRRVALPAGAEGAMPPRGTRLTAEQVKLLRDWVAAGAEWPAAAGAHWAYLPPKRPPAPSPGHPIDA